MAVQVCMCALTSFIVILHLVTVHVNFGVNLGTTECDETRLKGRRDRRRRSDRRGKGETVERQEREEREVVREEGKEKGEVQEREEGVRKKT